MLPRMMNSDGNAGAKGTRKSRNDTRIKPTTIRRRRISSNLVCATFGMLLLVLLDLPSTNRILFADAFASNLVETKMGCMTDLSTDEVIMNEDVKPPEESDFPKMHLAVLDESDKPIDATSFSYDPTQKTLQIAFVNPYSTSEFNDDLQFVMEIEGPTEDSRAAEFVSGGSVGCDNNKRVSGRVLANQASVVLQINDPTAKLRLWGGWATGHNAVRLTPDLFLEPGEASEDIEELKEEIREEEFQNTGEEKLLREEADEKLKRILNNDEEETIKEKLGLARKRKNLLQKPEHLPDNLIDPTKTKDLGLEIAHTGGRERGQTNDRAGESIRQKLQNKQLDIGNSKKNADRKKQKPRLTDHINEHRNRRDIPENLGMHEAETDDDLPPVLEAETDDVLPDEPDMDDAEINGKPKENPGMHPLQTAERYHDSSSHFLACAFFVASMGLFLTFFRKKRDKGRRDL